MYKDVHFWSFAQNLTVVHFKYFFLVTMLIGKNRFPFDWCYSWNRTINQLVVVGKKLKADLTQKNFFFDFFMLRRLESVFQDERKIFLKKFFFWNFFEKKFWNFWKNLGFETLFWKFAICTNKINSFMLMFRNRIEKTISSV